MIENIQVLRALAAAMVILVHCQTVLQPLDAPERFTGAFASGVDLFFVISGFIMVHTTRTPSPRPMSFILNRLVRIVPLYWTLTLATFLLAVIAPSVLGSTKADVVALFKSLFFVPYVRDDGTMRPILFLGWSLNYEMFFYLVFAGGLLIRKEAVRIAFIVSVLAILTAYGVVASAEMPAELAFLTRPIILEFALGMLLAAAYPMLPKSRSAGLGSVALAILSALMLVVAPLLVTTSWPVVALPATALLGAMLIMHRSGLSLDWRPLIILGDASYSLYLTHPFVAQAISKIAVRSGSLSPATSLWFLLAIYILSFGVAIASHRLLERPLSRLAKNAFRRRAIRPASLAQG